MLSLLLYFLSTYGLALENASAHVREGVKSIVAAATKAQRSKSWCEIVMALREPDNEFLWEMFLLSR